MRSLTPIVLLATLLIGCDGGEAAKPGAEPGTPGSSPIEAAALRSSAF